MSARTLRRFLPGRLSARQRAHRLAVLTLLFALLTACSRPAGDPEEMPAGAGTAVSATDDAGRTVQLARPATRVVSLLPAATETLLAMGAGDRLVGRTDYDTDPAVTHLPSVGGGLTPSLELLAALQPDLVVAWEEAGTPRVRPRLEELGIPVFAVATRDTAAIFRNIRNLGRLLGHDAAADSLVRHLHAELEAVRASVAPGERPSVLYVISIDPPIIAGTDNFIAELIGVAGGEPVQISGAQPGLSPQVSLEELVRQQPDIVVLPVGEDASASVERLRTEPGWRSLRAVQEGRVALVPAELMHRPGPRIGLAARAMHDALQAHREAR
ncbi:MAG TPA: cobalamin-binding protein [Longimicrobiaceae bacterium]|nr:cobalamin-binding protein [Longimicrobiaceae bacterium]